MLKIIEMMLRDKLITKDDLSKLVKSRPPKKVSVANLITENMLDEEKFSQYVTKKIRKGEITLEEVEQIEGIDSRNTLKMAAKELNVKFIDLDEIELDMRLFSEVPYKQLIKYSVIPVEETDLHVSVVFSDPLDMSAYDSISRIFPKKPISVAIASPKQILQYLRRLEANESIKSLIVEIRKDLAQESKETLEGESSAILKLIDLVLKSAIYAGASDIHIEALEKSCSVRERVDGMLRQTFSFDKDIFAPLSSRMKLLSNLDIAEKRKPQDGRFSATINGKDFDFRVSSLPTLFGESIVLRILDKTKAMIRLEDSGMSKVSYDKFSKAIGVPYGIVLVTGPTGSGKTTTLYGALNTIRDVKDKIITVEDPVEYQMSGIQQVQVNAHVGLSFSDALRSILRQDPDKIMIGEIRDTETLRIAIQAALTGHLVLSTLHTNDSISAINRMVDMGVENYLVSGALVGIQAQRLVRKICDHCKTPITLPSNVVDDIKEFVGDREFRFYKGEGCKECRHSGYAGREMVSEMLLISEKLSHMIAAGASKEELEKQAYKEGFESMFQDGINKALEGKTTLDEVYRVARL